ncbi:MAG: flavodoxin family protein [Oscillospiraceae bacterium]|nr:flavodoxin family protein [Oscillospiraceae bacterium]
MKVLLINGSPNPSGCVGRALKEMENVLNAGGIETKTYCVGNKDLRGCISCGKCSELKKCVFDDIVNEVAAEFETADGIVLGTPVYYAHANGTLLSFADRLFYSTRFNKNMKVGAAVASSRRAGSTSAFDDINKYFTICGMPVASSTYWNEVHGFCAEDVENDKEGLQTMRNLASNMAFLIKSIALGKEKFGDPKIERGAVTSFQKY